VDFEAETVMLREKKRRHDRRSTRRIPLTPFLAGVLRDWLRSHPGGQQLFVQVPGVARSKRKRATPTPVTADEAHDHFKRVVRGSKWEVLRGYHVFRHSFISLCASQGVDQRLIDEWVGHQTEEQRRRYRHLLPSTQQQAIARVFGD
jgi:integrase